MKTLVAAHARMFTGVKFLLTPQRQLNVLVIKAQVGIARPAWHTRSP
ncbi:hypothetical protein [Paracoccus sp. SY]|nr:hypothetical protein [Paracoccus sp. SY]